MFVRMKSSGGHRYLQVVESERDGRRVKQRVVTTLGRLDQLQAAGAIDSLLLSLGRFSEKVRVLEAHRAGALEARSVTRIGADLVFGRLWEALGLRRILSGLLEGRDFSFDVERAVYLSVLHRLFESGSDRAADRWRRDVRVPGSETIELHQLYRAMRWLGQTKDTIEERLFGRRRDLFTQVTLAFFDTTSIYFEGKGGASLGQHGHSKDHRPDLKQMVVGAVLTGEGQPVCCELWPGNLADANALLPVVDRVRERFGIRQVCWVADRGMISAKTIRGLEDRGLKYILGARMRRDHEVRYEVLGAARGRYEEVSPRLRVMDVSVHGRRYVVCFNPEEAAKDSADREAIVTSLERQLEKGTKHLIANRGYRRFLAVEKDAVAIDRARIANEAIFDGRYVLRTNTDLPAGEVATQYKRLLMVEQLFRASKSLIDTRPIFHQCDDTIRGHVFVSFLALVLLDELFRRVKAHDAQLEWAHVRQDLEALCEVEVRDSGRSYFLRSPLLGVTGTVLKAIGVAVPPAVRAGDGAGAATDL